MSESTESKNVPKQVSQKISKAQHDSLAGLLNQAAAINAEVNAKVRTILEGANKEVSPTARLIGVGVGPEVKIGNRKHYLIISV